MNADPYRTRDRAGARIVLVRRRRSLSPPNAWFAWGMLAGAGAVVLAYLFGRATLGDDRPWTSPASGCAIGGAP